MGKFSKKYSTLEILEILKKMNFGKFKKKVVGVGAGREVPSASEKWLEENDHWD